MITHSDYQAGLDFLYNLRDKQKAEGNPLYEFTEYVIALVIKEQQQTDLFTEKL